MGPTYEEYTHVEIHVVVVGRAQPRVPVHEYPQRAWRMRLKPNIHLPDGGCHVSDKVNVAVFVKRDDNERHHIVLGEVENGVVHALVRCHVDVGKNLDWPT